MLKYKLLDDVRCKEDARLPSWFKIRPIKRCWVSLKHISASLWVSRTGSSMSSVCCGASFTEASYRHCFSNHIIQNEMKKKLKMPQSTLTLACGNPVPFSAGAHSYPPASLLFLFTHKLTQRLPIHFSLLSLLSHLSPSPEP